jgi:acetyl/propionyl-CoA carboxylase alpha subunit
VSEPAATPSLQVIALGGNRYALDDGRRRRISYATRVGQATWVFLDGRIFVIQEADNRTHGPHAGDDAALAAPMPATVVAIEVSEGQRVSAGDILVRLEAMKMELSIKAPRDGTIAAINCRAGEFVQPGLPLVELQ